MDIYKVKKADKPVIGCVTVPGSKSVTNRALFMAAMAKGSSILRGVLFSDDSRHFIGSLKSLGYEMTVDEENKIVQLEGLGGVIPKKSGTIDVGSAGTAARFLTALLALSDGCYTINASEQMQARPMEDLFTALSELGAQFEYLRSSGHLPVRVKGRLYNKFDENIQTEKGASKPALVHVDISRSTQFLSALMMAGVLVPEGLDIAITSEKTDGAYIRITSAMMKDFGCEVLYDGHDYHVAAGQVYRAGEYDIEPDISAACYFWSMAAITGGCVTVKGSRRDMMQGDMKFLDLLERMGCSVNETAQGIAVTGPGDGHIKAVEVDMNDFSDQTMTLAAIAPFADGTTYIYNIGHIRLQESDRINAILVNLEAMGIECETLMKDGREGIYIKGGIPHGAHIQTFEDHRMAMAFALTGLRTEDIVIENPKCCGKTFENYFNVLEKVTE